MVSVVFIRPMYLWLLLIIIFLVVVHFITVNWFRKKAVSFANFEAIERVTGSVQISQNFLILFMMVFSFVLLIFSAAGTTFVYEGQGTDSDYVLTIDTSSSMSANDLEPSRIEAAKEAALNFVNYTNADTKFGLITFSSVSVVENGLNDNHDVLKEKISDIGIRSVGGTNLGEAITTSVNLLLNSDKGKTIVLLTDGRGNIGSPLDEAVNYAILNVVTIHTIAVGTLEGGNIINGTDILLKVDEGTLKDIADPTGGMYYKAESKEDLNRAYKEIANLKTKLISRDISLYLLLAALIVLTFTWGILNLRFRTIP